ncbi:MAG: HopJ type III effector protein, partial [Pseudomonadota bacterium]|nr:HopJ type III effector protein [Pseudomonadota bacterium]
PESVHFSEVIALIDQEYRFEPTAFKNGDVDNAADQNNGSCKILAFGKRHSLSKEATLHCFGDYYRKDVLENPEGQDHANIRNFIRYGWDGVQFDKDPFLPFRSH